MNINMNMNMNMKLLYTIRLSKSLLIVLTFFFSFLCHTYSSLGAEGSNEEVEKPSNENCDGDHRCSVWQRYANFLEQQEEETNNLNCESENDDGSSTTVSPTVATPSATVLSIGLLPPISMLNAKSYNIRGTCDSQYGNVIVVIGNSYIQKSLTCTSKNEFSGNFKLEGGLSNPTTIRVSQKKVNLNGSGAISIVVKNTIVNTIHPFITKWNIPNDNHRFTLPLKSNETLKYNFLVNWGDGSSAERVTSFDGLDKVHTYKKAGNYTIKISGICEGFQNDGVSKNMLLEVANLGQVGWKDLSNAFKGNSSLTKFLGGNTSKVTNMSNMFSSASKVNPNTSGWDTSKVTDMSYMFYRTGKATPDTDGWNTSKVTNMSNMFSYTHKATPDTSGWNTSKVTDMSNMFYHTAKATPNTDSWDTSSVTNMKSMFAHSPLANPDTSGWKTSSVTNMGGMFARASEANPDTSKWDTSSVTDMSNMFYDATKANPNTSGWNTSNVTLMQGLFSHASQANPDTSGWDFTDITAPSASYSAQRLHSGISGIFQYSSLSIDNYSKFLIRLNQKTPTSRTISKVIDVRRLKYNYSAATARHSLQIKGWTIRDGGLDRQSMTGTSISLAVSTPSSISSSNIANYVISGTCNSSLGTVRVVVGQPPGVQKDLPCTSQNTFAGSFDLRNIYSAQITINASQSQGGSNVETTHSSIFNDSNYFITKWRFSGNHQFTLPLKADPSLSYNFTVDWGDGSKGEVTSFNDSDKVHTYTTAGDYTIKIVGTCEGFQNSVKASRDHLLEVINLGNMGWKDLSEAFFGNTHLTTFDGGNISNTINISNMFAHSPQVTPNTSRWDTSKVINMRSMFAHASQANPDTRGWSTSKVIDMSFMFAHAAQANPDVSQWNTSNVLDMGYMFLHATQASPDVSRWNTSGVLNISYMFRGATQANPDVSGWDFTNLVDSNHRHAVLTTMHAQNNPFYHLFQRSGLSVENYSKFLININAKPPTNVNIQKMIYVGTLKYNYSAVLVRNGLKGKGWVITDGGLDSESPRDNHVPWLRLGDSLPPLSSSNGESYTIRGTCNSNLGTVRVIVGDPAIQKDLPCTEQNTFSGTFDLRNQFSSNITIRANQSGVNAEAGPSIVNNLNHFVTKWRFPSNYQFTLPLKSGSSLDYNFTVNWGDGASSTVTSFNDPDKVHTYARAGDYTIKIVGTYEGFQNNSSSKSYLVEVPNLGNMGWEDLSSAFKGNSSLTNVAGGKTSSVTDMSNMFYEAGQSTPDTSSWSTSNVTNMSNMFYEARQANPNTSGWDTSSVTNMSNMFYQAGQSTPDTSSWNTSSVTNMSNMFYEARQANPNTSGWNTSSVTNMSNMFYEARQANPDTSGWNTSSVTNMSKMFDRAAQADPDTSNWDFRNITTLTHIFSGSGLSIDNYSDFLIRLNERIPTSTDIEKVINVGTLQYRLNALLAHHSLRGASWSITDGGVDSQSMSGGINVPWLSIDALSLGPVSSVNAAAYTIHGTCNANLGTVRVVVGRSNLQKDLSCTESNVFSGIFNLQNMSSPKITVRASQDEGRAEINTSLVNDLNYFVTKWRISGSRSLTLPLKSGASLNYNFTVDWGDGNTSEVTSFSDTDKTHTYTTPGDYTIKIKGVCEGFQNDSSSKRYLLEVSNLGNMGWKDLSKAFQNNSELIHVLGGNTSHVTNMSHMFYGAGKATPDTSGWDTSNVANMSFMFSYALKVDPDVSHWNTSNVTNMKGLFYGTQTATPDTSRWNTSRVTDMSLAFSYATLANPDTSQWDFTSVTNIQNLFSTSSLSVENYSKFLISFDENTPTSTSIQKVINVHTLKYNSSAVSARANLVSQGGGWTIHDGGEASQK